MILSLRLQHAVSHGIIVLKIGDLLWNLNHHPFVPLPGKILRSSGVAVALLCASPELLPGRKHPSPL